jgi:predicted CXXCH cytochrome family protein
MGRKATVACFYCHKREQKIKEFGMSQKFICLKCHPYLKHPSEIEHMVIPSSELSIISQIELDKKGKIKCSTCHDPHLEGKKNKKLRVFEDITICEACHQF